MPTIQIHVSVLEPPLSKYIGPDSYERFLINSIRTYKDVQEIRIEKNKISISIEKNSNNSSSNTFTLTISSPTANDEVIRGFSRDLCDALVSGETIKPVTISKGGYRRRTRRTKSHRSKSRRGKSRRMRR